MGCKRRVISRRERGDGACPGLFVAAILIVPVHSLGVTLAEYVGAWLGAAGVGTIRLVRVTTATGGNQAVGDSLSYRSLVRVRMPVLGANLAASLAQFGDRILVSFSVPIRIFALYGFASSVMVAASAGVHALSRVSLSHAAAARRRATRAVFLGELYDFLGVGFGIALAGIPLFEHLVAWWLPAFDAGAPDRSRARYRRANLGRDSRRCCRHAPDVWVGSATIRCGTGQRALVAVACGAAIVAHAPLWAVAAAASGAAVIAWGTSTWFIRRVIPDARSHHSLRFIIIVAAQAGALAVAIASARNWLLESLIYIILAAAHDTRRVSFSARALMSAARPA